MRQHGPKAAHGRRRDADSELGDVALEKTADEVFAPAKAVGLRCRQKGPRESASPPQRERAFGSRFGQVEACKVDKFDTACKRFGGAPHQFGRCAAKDQEARVRAGPVGQHPQRSEEGGHDLDFVQHNQAFQVFQRHLGIGERAHVLLRLKIEQRGFAFFGKLLRQRGFAALPRA